MRSHFKFHFKTQWNTKTKGWIKGMRSSFKTPNSTKSNFTRRVLFTKKEFRLKFTKKEFVKFPFQNTVHGARRQRETNGKTRYSVSTGRAFRHRRQANRLPVLTTKLCIIPLSSSQIHDSRSPLRDTVTESAFCWSWVDARVCVCVCVRAYANSEEIVRAFAVPPSVLMIFRRIHFSVTECHLTGRIRNH